MPGVKGSRNKVKPKTPTDGVPKFSNGRPLQVWAYEAYTAHVGECRAIRSLADEYDVSEATIRRNVDAVHVAVLAVENSDTIDALAKHRARLQKIIRAAWQDHAAAEEGQKSSYLRIAMDASERLAAAEGVVTDRKSLALGQDPALDPVGGDALEQLTSAIARLAARGDGTGSAEEPDA
jgi:hypothetical protein